MGNSAMITNEEKQIAIYLHWNGGRDSVEAFLEYARIKGNRGNEYGMARLIQIIGNFFGGTLSLGVYPYDPNFRSDNGIYIINKNFEIVGRENFEGEEQNEYYDRLRCLLAIDERQPNPLGKNYLHAPELSICPNLKKGDVVAFLEYGEVQRFEIVGFGADIMVNGKNVKGLPMIKRFGLNPQNINNYITPERNARLIEITK